MLGPGPRKGQGGNRTDSWAHRLDVLGSAAAAVTGETVGDNPLPPPAARVAPLPTGEHGDGSCGGGICGGQSHDNKVVARGRQNCLESMLTRLGDDVSRQLESVAAGERKLNGSRQGSGGGRCSGGGELLRVREEARLLRAEETALLAEIAERRDRVTELTEELRDAEDAVQEVGGVGSGVGCWKRGEKERGRG